MTQPVIAIIGDPHLITGIISHADEGVLFQCFQVCKEWKRIVTEKVLHSIRPLFEKIVRTPFNPEDGRKSAVSLIQQNRNPLFTDENFKEQMAGPIRDLLEAFYDHSLPDDFFMRNQRFFYDISRLSIEKALVPVNMEVELKTGINGGAPMDYTEFLVKQSPTLRVDAIKMAAQVGKLDLVRHLLNSCPISQEQSESVVAFLWEEQIQSCPHPSIHSVQNGRAALAIIHELLAKGLISDSCRDKALEVAAYCGDHGLAEALLKNGPISDACRESAVELAAYSGALKLIQGLFLVNGTISVKGRGDAVAAARFSVSTKMATENDAARIIQVLLKTAPFQRVFVYKSCQWRTFTNLIR